MAAEPIPARITAGCAAVRPATPADQVAGVQPQMVASPASTSEASTLLRAAAELGLAVVPRGTGSRLHWGNPPERCDLVIETTQLDEVVEHAAGDLVATVQAGVRLDRLAGVLAAAGQRLALDPPAGREAGQGTIGGVLATGAAGPLRLRYGTGRDLLIGITVVRADGTIARSGGKVVKNVAGYDLGKLFAGSCGTLGLITQATFRLHPLPAQVAYVAAACRGSAEVFRALTAATAPAFSPFAAEMHWPSAAEPVQVCIALEGDPASVAGRCNALSALLSDDEPASIDAEPPAWWSAGAAAESGGTVLQIGFWPGDLATVITEIRRAAASAGLDPAVGGSAAAGQLYSALPDDAEPGAVAKFVTALRESAGLRGHMGSHPADGPPARTSVVIQHAPEAVAAEVDLFGPVSSLPLMRAVKAQFDPGRMMAPGRFAGGI
ncbi:MAG: FAD-binding oxidoreductase [Streptosporangiaceae bacterium]